MQAERGAARTVCVAAFVATFVKILFVATKHLWVGPVIGRQSLRALQWDGGASN